MAHYWQLKLLLLASLLAAVKGLYSSKSSVQSVDEKSFNSKVVQSDAVVYVEFFAPWCGHCKSLVPEYEKAASHLKGVVNVVAVDATQAESLARKYDVKGYPTILVFGADKRSPITYSGERKADAITADALSQVRTLVRKRQGGGSKPTKKDTPPKKESKQKQQQGPIGGATGKVVELTAATFESVLSSDEPWMVEFYAPWCGHCKNLAPEWAAAARELQGAVNLGALDASNEANKDIAARYGIQGFPTIKTFGTDKRSPADYAGPRTSAGITTEGMKLFAAAGGAAAVTQLSSSAVLDKKCKSGSKQKLCVVAVLPHLLDGGAAARQGYLDQVTGAAKKMRSTLFTYLWSEGGAQPSLEENFGLTFGFPALVAMSLEKGVYAVHIGSFSVDGIAAFLTGITTGATKTTKFSEQPRIADVAEWDGKDAAPVQEEMSLEELFGDEL